MDIEYLVAKNNQKTFKYQNTFYHSAYNPLSEAERFFNSILDTLQETIPSIIFLVEPGLNYLPSLIRTRFPNTKIVLISLINKLERFIDKQPSNKIYDYQFEFTPDLENKLILSFTEEQLINSKLFCWPQTKTIFNDKIDSIFTFYKNIMEYSKTVLITREYFESKWLINSCYFFKYLNKIVIPQNIDKPIVIAASGPSLKKVIPLLKQNRENYILFALSSAILPLINNQLIPDICISTDGGFYAQRHLNILHKYEIPLILSPESFVNKQLLKILKIIPINYLDGLSSNLFIDTKINYLNANRNGTVSGTALELALNLTNNKIFFCGLDLQNSNGFNHTQPNQLEMDKCIFDTRIKTKETRICPSSFTKFNSSLAIYRQWFCNYSNTNRIYRIINDSTNSKLGQIQDIDNSSFSKLIATKNTNKLKLTEYECSKNNVIEKVIKNIKSEKWQKQLFPISYYTLTTTNNTQLKEKITCLINEKNSKLERKINRLK